MIDAEYLASYRRYAAAMRALDIALAEHRLRWGAGAAKRPPARRPAAVRAGAALRGSAGQTGAPFVPGGAVLSSAVSGAGGALGGAEAPYPAVAAHETTAAALLARRRHEYEAARRAFFDHVRRMRADAFGARMERAKYLRDRAADAVTHGMRLVWLGQDGDHDPLAEARAAVTAYCGRVWDAYRAAMESPEAQKALVLALLDAQAVGADGEGVVRRIQDEVNRLATEAGPPTHAPTTPRKGGAFGRSPGGASDSTSSSASRRRGPGSGRK